MTTAETAVTALTTATSAPASVKVPPATRSAPSTAGKVPRLGYQIFDMEIHNSYRSAKELIEYLPERYRQRYREVGTQHGGLAFDQRGGGNRRDAVSPDGDPPATSARFIAKQLLDPYDVEYIVCTGGMYPVGTLPDVEYAAALCSAYNDWQTERWLPQDQRFLGTIAIAPEDPELAVAEIERVGHHPRMVEVIMSAASSQPYGKKRYWPIYAACERMGLPVATHTTTEGRGITGSPTSAGYPSRYLEYHTNLGLNCMAQLASLVCEGALAAHPGLRFILMEGGVSWVPPLLWRLDQGWKLLRSEMPQLTELPSAYVKRQMRFGTQPIEEPSNPDLLLETWALVNGERTLLFSSDYPHWDADDAFRALPVRMPADMRRRILRENARELFAAKLGQIEGARQGPESSR